MECSCIKVKFSLLEKIYIYKEYLCVIDSIIMQVLIYQDIESQFNH